MHRSRFALFAASALLAAPAGASEFAADTVVLDDIIGALAITTGEGEAVTIDIDPGAGVVEPPEVTERDGVVSVFGPALHVRECRGGDGEPELGLPGGGRAPLSDFPRVSITAPRDVTVILRDVLVFGEVGDVAAAEVSASGCGELVFGDIAGAAQLRLRGSGGLSAGDIGAGAELAVDGSGDLDVGAVSGDLAVAVRGSGDVRAGQASGGDLRLDLLGSGDAIVAGGEVEDLAVSIMGSGDARFDGRARRARLSVMGSGAVQVAEVTGEVDRSRFGSGEIIVGR